MPTISSTVGARVGSVVGSISGATLTITEIISGSIAPGQKITGTGIAAGTYITAKGSGTGGTGTYTVSIEQTVMSTAISAARDYATIPEWVASIPTNLVTDGNAREALVYNDGEVVITASDLGGYLNLPGSLITSADCFIRVKAAAGERVYGGRMAYDPGAGPSIRTTGYGTMGADIRTNYVTIENMQFKSSDTFTTCVRIDGTNSRMVGCVVDGNRGTNETVRMEGGSTVLNCFILNRNSSSGKAIASAYGANVINCTLARPSNVPAGATAVSLEYQTSTVRNNLVLGFTDFVSLLSTTLANSGTNVCSGTSSVAGDVQNVVFADQVVQGSVASSVEDFRIKTGSAAINAGIATTGQNANQYDMYGNYRQTPDAGAYEIPEPANAILLFGPSSCIVGQPSDAFTVMLNGTRGVATVVTPSATGVTFTPASVTIPAGESTRTFTATASSTGAKTVTLTNDSAGAIANPAGHPLTASVLAPTGAVTSQPAPDGQNLTITFSTASTPASGTATLSPASSNPNGAVSIAGTVSLGSGTGTASFTGIQPGNYAAPVITLTNEGGSNNVTGTQPVSILGISGAPEGPTQANNPPAPSFIGTRKGRGRSRARR